MLLNGFSAAAQTLADEGKLIWPGFLSQDEVRQLRADMDARRDTFHAAGIGREQGYQRDTSIRGDEVLWLENDAPLSVPILSALENLRQTFNSELYLGLAEFEAHFAVYPLGGFYKRHLDQHRNRDTRVVTFVLYLNEDWHEQDGGQLRIYLDGTQSGAWQDVTPHGGTLVLFLSDRFEHEVIPATRERRSLTGWFRRRAL
ncbi:SM-20-related protein [Silvimonas terrae]|uniref:SM-20-related protein n=1 Tax=Silvimonas terrae TaxID=300266 RepID=A0A840RHQ0_9NEIS|nr:2OG-Fe(II) oxygenase [Silvimonas terrae]MBB5193159.1 SM-20-related protein [Silvimonas terrae]